MYILEDNRHKSTGEGYNGGSELSGPLCGNRLQLLRAKRAPLAKGGRPGQTNTNCCRANVISKFLHAIYPCYFPAFSHKNLRLSRESLVLCKYHKIFATFSVL